MIEQNGDSLRVTFDRWTPEAYDLFLRTKRLPEHALQYDEDRDAYTIETPARFARLLGVDVPAPVAPPLPLAGHLFDYQAFLTRESLAAKRYAVWADTGLGKTHIGSEWLRQVLHLTSGRVLAVVPLNLIPQWIEMGSEFYGDQLRFEQLGTREDMVRWCRSGSGLGIVNAEKFIPRDGVETIPEITFCAGVLLDESSLLKTGGGAIKWALIKSCRGVEYKLSLTATPAPNDPIEYASQASWLEKIRDEGEVIWTYFTRDSEGEWKVKDHALAAFYRFLSGWSCYLRHPAKYGFRDNLRDLPDPQRFVHELEPTPEQLAALAHLPDIEGQRRMFGAARHGIVERTRMGTLAAGFVYDGKKATRIPSAKPGFIADLVRREVADGLQVIVWTSYDETARLIGERLTSMSGVETLTGATPLDERPGVIGRFKSGTTRVLVSRPRVLGFGTNLQQCGSMVFGDLTDSYEQVYQAERRAYRYGQTRSVRIHFPIVRELQTPVWANLQAKAGQFEADVARMEALYIEAMREQLPLPEAA